MFIRGRESEFRHDVAALRSGDCVPPISQMQTAALCVARCYRFFVFLPAVRLASTAR